MTRWVVRAVGTGALAAIGWLFSTVLSLSDKMTAVRYWLRFKGIMP